jgi:putative membrane protein
LSTGAGCRGGSRDLSIAIVPRIIPVPIAMLSFGFWRLGVRRTLIFVVASTASSAAAELTGTKTGWPFGGYEYTSFLGAKLLGSVPFAIPLSWFSMGFASFMLADAIVFSLLPAALALTDRQQAQA